MIGAINFDLSLLVNIVRTILDVLLVWYVLYIVKDRAPCAAPLTNRLFSFTSPYAHRYVTSLLPLDRPVIPVRASSRIS